MTTLPPEENENTTPGIPAQDAPAAPDAPSAPSEPVAPAGGQVPPNSSYPAPQQPNYPPAPQQPGYPAPQQPGAFPTGPQPGFGAPPNPGYGAPQQPGYGSPQQPGYGAPQAPPGYYQPQGAQANPISNLQTNYWLSVFFIWVPALIFYLIEKDRATPQVRALHAANLNFSLMRTGLFVVGWILAIVPVLGPLLMGVAHLAGFVLHIIAATKVSDTYARGGGDPFLFNLPMVK